LIIHGFTSRKIHVKSNKSVQSKSFNLNLQIYNSAFKNLEVLKFVKGTHTCCELLTDILHISVTYSLEHILTQKKKKKKGFFDKSVAIHRFHNNNFNLKL
jgi:hypothetical protein